MLACRVERSAALCSAWRLAFSSARLLHFFGHVQPYAIESDAAVAFSVAGWPGVLIQAGNAIEHHDGLIKSTGVKVRALSAKLLFGHACGLLVVMANHFGGMTNARVGIGGQAHELRPLRAGKTQRAVPPSRRELHLEDGTWAMHW